MQIKTMLILAVAAIGGLGIAGAAKADHFHRGPGCYRHGPSPYYSQRVTVYQYGPALPPPVVVAPPPVFGPPASPGFIGPHRHHGFHAGFGGPGFHFHYSRSRYGY